MSSNRVYRPFTTLEAWIDTGLDRNAPDAQLGTQLSSHSKPTPTGRADPQRFHRICPIRPDRKAVLDTRRPPITNCPQHPNDRVAGRTTKFELTSNRIRRGDELAATELAAAPHTNMLIDAMNGAAFRITCFSCAHRARALLRSHPTTPRQRNAPHSAAI